MASNRRDPKRQSGWRTISWGAAALLLLVPLVSGWPWTLSDYVFAGAIFAIIGGTFELAVRKSGNPWYRSAAAVALATAFMLLWINGAVGIIGDEDNPANLMFLAVIAVAIAGSFVARFRAPAMAVAMLVAAISQSLVALIVLVLRLGADQPPGLAGVTLLTLCFALTWLLSASLFRRAAGQGER